MSVFETLETLDVFLFALINQTLTNSFFDRLMPVFTDLHKLDWFVFGAFPGLLVYWFLKRRWEAARMIVGLAVVVGATDAISARWIKPTIQRERPPTAGVVHVLRTDRYGGYSMPSNHAANISSGMTYLVLAYPQVRVPAILLAAAVAYSRVYVGVHFPGDVLAGALLGMLIAILGARLMNMFYGRLVLYLKR